MAEHTVREGNLAVSLTDKSPECDGIYFAVTVGRMQGDRRVESDSARSGMFVSSSHGEIDAYLVAAMEFAEGRCGPDLNVCGVADSANESGMCGAERAYGASILTP